MKPFLRTIAGLLVLMAGVVFLSMPARAQQAATPEEVARGFYSWYLHQLSRENVEPLKQKTTALKYLTPQLYANAPRLIRRLNADIFICAQDWDKDWEKNFTVSTPQVGNRNATATVTLPSGETDRIKINVTLIKTASGWRINKVACANDQALIRERIQKIMDETIKAGQTVIMGEGQRVVATTFMPPSSEATAEIKSYGDLAVPILAEYLRQATGFEKYHAMRFLGAIGGESVVAPLSHVALNDPSEGYREYALGFLTQAPWKLAAPILQEAAKHDASIRVRQSAKELLEGYAPR